MDNGARSVDMSVEEDAVERRRPVTGTNGRT